MDDELTVIVPVFNEEESLPAFFQDGQLHQDLPHARSSALHQRRLD